MKKPSKQDVKTAIRVLRFLRDDESENVAYKIQRAPDGKYWDGYVSRISKRSEEFSENIDNLIDEIKNRI